MRWWAILLALAACGNYPKNPNLPKEPMAACGQILRQCYAVYKKCEAERYAQCESGCAAQYVYEDDVRACVDACFPCTRERIACGEKPSCNDAQEHCEDGAHALVVSYDVASAPALLCQALCDPGVGSPADGCDGELGESCREVARLADVSKLREQGGAVFTCR